MATEPGKSSTETQFLQEFLRAYHNWGEYPSTLPTLSLSEDIRDEFHELFRDHGERLFSSERQSRISLWEYSARAQEFSDEEEIDDPQELHEYLQERDEKDIQYRHVFINSAHSRSPLNCTEGLLKRLLTYHQVAPFILDDLATFGLQGEQLDVCLSRFTDHNAYYMHSTILPLPTLGRSGFELRHSFLLRSAELGDPEDRDPWRWRIRPCAVYHSFDAISGKAFWITVKANDVIQKKIMSNTPKFPAYCSQATGQTTEKGQNADVPLLLAATLATHLIYFHCCESSWRWFIREIDQFLNSKAGNAREFPVDRRPFTTNLPVSRGTGVSSPTMAEPLRQECTQRQKGFLSCLSRMRPSPRSATTAHGSSCPEKRAGEDMTHDEATVLGEFNCRDLQNLAGIHRRLEEARRACELNQQVLNDICRYYSKSCQYYFPGNMDRQSKKAIKDAISQFIRKVESITTGFERSAKQLESLRTIVAETDIPLLESILQLRGSYASRMFAEAAHAVEGLMQNLAAQTALISSAGYIITLLAFIPLCATFTTGLLQSPIFDCEAESQSCGVNYGALRLFGLIAGPLTVLVLVGFLYWKRRARMKMESSMV